MEWSDAETGARTREIDRLIEPTLAALGYSLVRVRFTGKGRPVLQVMAERNDLVDMTVDDCAKISRALSAVLDVEDPIAGQYTLEVSSPGIDRPLVKLDDYVRFAGEEAKLQTRLPIEGRRRFRGKLLGVEGEKVHIAMPEGEFAVDWRDVTDAKLVLTDDLIARATKRARVN